MQDAQSITEKCSKGSTVAAGEWRALLPLQKRGPRPDCVKAFIPITKARDHQAGLRGTAERNHTLLSAWLGAVRCPGHVHVTYSALLMRSCFEILEVCRRLSHAVPCNMPDLCSLSP